MISFEGVAKTRTLFLQFVSLSYAIAFYSLYTQIPGLYGDDGLLPAAGLVPTNAINNNKISELLWNSPTVLYFAPSLNLSVTQMMEVLCLMGTVLGLLVTVKPSFLTKPVLIILWVSYLSVYKVGQTFLWFQWDILLLETGFLAIILAPVLWGYHRSSLPQDQLNMFLIRWLLFRMMFASGVVKLTSGCPTWWGLTAMPTHYFSQCIPTPLAWFANLLPDWLHKLSVASTFVIEIPLTFFFFAPSASMRKFTFFHQNMLMIMIMLTGNYNFFNFLYMALCLSLADDTWIVGRLGGKPQHPVTRCLCCLLHLSVYAGLGLAIAKAFNLRLNDDFTLASDVAFSMQQFDDFLAFAVPAGILLGAIGLIYASVISLYKSWTLSRFWSLFNSSTVLVYVAVAAFMFSTSLPSFTGQLDRTTYDKIPKSIKELDRALNQFELTSSYGLFRRMTGVGGRPEIILEGSDNIHGPWKEYNFLYKPGDVTSPPKFCLPHQPRLDWQMWFAALGSYQQNPWFVSLVQRLLEGQKDVLQLLDPSTPFKTIPPKYIRARQYKYTFTGPGSSDWWVRTEETEYFPMVSKEDGLDQMLKKNGIIGAKSTPGKGLVPDVLKTIRNLTDGFPPHIQIWSFAWLALPLFRPFFLF